MLLLLLILTIASAATVSEIVANARTHLISHEPYPQQALHWKFSQNRAELEAIPNVQMVWNRDLETEMVQLDEYHRDFSECMMVCISCRHGETCAPYACDSDNPCRNMFTTEIESRYNQLKKDYVPYDVMILL
jgi:hypothetical protein